MCGAFWLLATAAGYWLVARLSGKNAAVVLLTGMLVLPRLVAVGCGGLETSLSLFLILASALLFVKIADSRGPRLARWALLGLLVGLSVVARTDNLFWLLSLLATILLLKKSSLRHAKPAHIKAFCSVAVAPALAFLLWSLVTVGTPVQSSGAALSLFAWRIEQPADYGLSGVDELASKSAADFLGSVESLTGIPASWLAALIVATLIAGSLSTPVNLARSVARARFLLPLVLQSLLLLAFYSLCLRHIQLWYIVPAAVLWLMAVSLLFAWLARSLAELVPKNAAKVKTALTAVAVAALVTAGLSSAQDLRKDGLYPWQKEMYKTALILQDHLKPSDVLGAFNSGIYGCLLPCTVVNLDGVVNNKVVRFLGSKRLDEYIDRLGVGYLVDYQQSFLRYSRATARFGFPGFDVEAVLSGSWMGTPIWVCKRTVKEVLLDPTVVRLSHGFYSQEEWAQGAFPFRWSKGPSSTITIVAATTAFDLQLTIWAYPLEICGFAGQVVTVSFNGKELGKVKMAQGWHEYRLRLPAGALRPGRNALTFAYRYTIRPAIDCAASLDETRELAVAFAGAKCQRTKRSIAKAAPS